MAVNSGKVLASRDIAFFYVAYSSTNSLPAETVLWGTAWGTPSGQSNPWIDGGYTQGGLNFSAEIGRADIRMDQAIDPVARPATSRTVTMSTNLGQFDLNALVYATGQGSVATKAPTTANAGYDEWSMGNTIASNYMSVGFDINNPNDSLPIRVFGPYAQPTGAENWNFSPAAAAVTPFNVTLLPRPSDQAVAFIRDVIPHL